MFPSCGAAALAEFYCNVYCYQWLQPTGMAVGNTLNSELRALLIFMGIQLVLQKKWVNEPCHAHYILDLDLGAVRLLQRHCSKTLHPRKKKKVLPLIVVWIYNG